MDTTRRSAHPVLEPLNYDLTPEEAPSVLYGEELQIYSLLWNAAVGSVTEGPALREEILTVSLSSTHVDSKNASIIDLQARALIELEEGWARLLPSEYVRLTGKGGPRDQPWPALLEQGLLACGPVKLDSSGCRQRSAAQCNSLPELLGPPKTWECEIVEGPRAVLDQASIIEQMAEHGVGRPSTFADRLRAAFQNDLIVDSSAGIVCGARGNDLLQALARLPEEARLGARYSTELELALQEVERDSLCAGEVLSRFCVRALSQEPALARWLDALDVQGESLEQAAVRIERTLPPAESWDTASLPEGIQPRFLAHDAEAAVALRQAVDERLAAPSPSDWKRYQIRQRAAWRLAALVAWEPASELEPWIERSNRNLVWRWWLDLGPAERPLQAAEVSGAVAQLQALLSDQFGALAALRDKIQAAL